jgi:uncharacterized protein DUF5996
MNTGAWPEIPYRSWQDTCSALHLYAQVVGKYALAHTPWVNHSWHATLHVTPQGLTTALVPDGDGIQVLLDLQQHVVRVRNAYASHSIALKSGSVADLYQRFCAALTSIGGTPEFDRLPNELPDPVRFDEDRLDRPYDADAVSRFHRALITISLVFQRFRTGFLGKVTPVHLFWGSFDLAVTRFSGRRAPLHPGGIPHLPDEVAREAYSHEVCSAGFWPGTAGSFEEPAFYSYAYPEPDDYRLGKVRPHQAYFHKGLGEFILPYDSVRLSADPEAQLMQFLQSTYDAAADLGAWDRASLDCPTGAPLRPRPI